MMLRHHQEVTNFIVKYLNLEPRFHSETFEFHSKIFEFHRETFEFYGEIEIQNEI